MTFAICDYACPTDLGSAVKSAAGITGSPTSIMAGNTPLPSAAAFSAGLASGNYKVVVGRAYTIPAVTDGTSNSMLLAEDAGRPDDWVAGTKTSNVRNDAGWADPQSSYSVDTICGGSKVIKCKDDSRSSSFQPCGANLPFGHGGVRFLRPSTDVKIVAALVTAANGEVSPGDY